MRPRDIGTVAETAVVRVLRDNGFPHAERRALHGALDLGDITGTPGIVWEVKGGDAAKTASDGQVERWREETDREAQNAGAPLGILVLQRKGIGTANASRWWAILDASTLTDLVGGKHEPRASDIVVRLHLLDLLLLLRAAGWGDPL